MNEAITTISRYKFTWQSKRDKLPNWSGVKQGDELGYIFGVPFDNPGDFTDEERELSERIMSYWANFARTGYVFHIYNHN